MKNIRQIFFLTLLMVLATSGSLHAEKLKGEGRRSSSPKPSESATCLPANSSNELSVNNVRAYIETGGTMWFKEVSEYEVPKGSGKTSMFCSALWIGGLDSQLQLKLAAVRFRQVGDDYWTGPLKLTGASTTQSTCIKYDRHFKITRAEVDEHIASYNTSGYVMPASIANWPAHGDEGYSYYLAPFKDVNDNGIYDPENGDYPYYDIDNDLCPWTEENIALAAAHELPRTPEDLLYYGDDWRNSNGMIYSDHVLKGDETLFWIFNDNAGPHTESNGPAIGLEIRGQAFAFTTNDELNNMTFYSYEIINRSTYTLTETYFSQWADPDLGFAEDDYVGCDVVRGLGYCYNGPNVDGSGQSWAYGDQPPAVGIDFFQGPYMDPDGRDNPKFHVDSASYSGYCGKFLNSSYALDMNAINGVNFGDQIVDNERYGMRRFVFHNNSNGPVGDPNVAWEYYNLLKGIWKDNTRMKYGGNAHASNGGVGPACDFMFPGMSDPCNWGTMADPNTNETQYGPDGWTEINVGNAPADRRIMQSAGPFTLKPGSVNYITVGIPWARASQGGAMASVELLKRADDKCQSLFENCFKTLDGPDAPDVTIRELENELIIYLSNNNPLRNNYHETYTEIDPQISSTMESFNLVEIKDSIMATVDGRDTVIYTTSYETVKVIDSLTQEQRSYVFEGYQIYQLKNSSVSVTELDNPDKARLVAQCDIKNGIGQLINWTYSDALGTSVPTEMVKGADEGIKHSFRITDDKFASGTNTKLVNHKEYYYLVLAYGYNEFKPFKLEDGYMDGQVKPYLAGRKYIQTYVGIPHKPAENILKSKYGDIPMITRIEGQGNGGIFLDMTDESRENVLANNVYNNIQYKNNYGPLSVRVIDPLMVKPFDYTVKFLPNSISDDVNDSTLWQLEISEEVTDEELAEIGVDRVTKASMPISMTNEELFLDLGISVSIKNANFSIRQDNLNEYIEKNGGYTYANVTMFGQPDAVGSDLSFSGDIPWLSGLSDIDGNYPANWIRAGQQVSVQHWEGWAGEGGVGGQEAAKDDYNMWRVEDFFNLFSYTAPEKNPELTRGFMDPAQQYESFVSGTWAPYMMSSPYDGGPKANYLVEDNTRNQSTTTSEPVNNYYSFRQLNGLPNRGGYNQTLTNVYSVDIVLTPDKSLWTRALVLEAGSSTVDDNFVVKQNYNGQTYNNYRHEPKNCPSVDKDGNPDNSGTTGFGWFPGYAINVETGERLNIMFAENSLDELNNGNDMIFNPTSVYAYARDPRADTFLLDEEGNKIELGMAAYNNLRDSWGLVYGEPMNGGRHYVYVFGSSGNTANTYYESKTKQRNYNDSYGTTSYQGTVHGGTFTGTDGVQYPYYECGPYDECRWVSEKFKTLGDQMSSTARKVRKMEIFNNVMWTSIPMPAQMYADQWLSSEATVKLRVARPYLRYSSRWYDDPSQAPNASQNDGYPMFEFTTKNVAAEKLETVQNFDDMLQDINIVPNPYYGYSNYEHNALENYIRIVNLPAKCTISIYTVNGTLIRTLTKGSDAQSFVQWDLKNHANIPIASGVYIIHVKADGYGERTLRFFCNMRPTDLNGF